MADSVAIVTKEKCTGCKMCAAICPHNAISFPVSSEGFWYPQISEQECVNCGLCTKKCPAMRNDKYETKRTAYAAWSRDDDIRRDATSGGIYYEFAKYFLDQGGVLAGCSYSDDYKSAFHMITDNYEGLNRLKGSKYFQSDTQGIYEEIRNVLKMGKKVLFTGTPCQVVALKNYLQQDYDNLLTVDFICRGVPSPKVHEKKIELYQDKTKSIVTSYRDKSKLRGWANFGELIQFANGRQKFISRWKDEINNCFIEKNLSMREACYTCKYKDGNNASDITLGDFWGIKGVTRKDHVYGVSAVITNNEKGKAYLQGLKDRIYMAERPLQEVGVSNSAYLYPVERPQNRDIFFQKLEKCGLDKTVKSFTKRNVKERLRQRLRIVKGRLYPYLPLIRDFWTINWLKFIWINYIHKAVKRNKGVYIIPYRGASLHIAKTATIIVNGNISINNYSSYKRRNSTAIFQVGDHARLYVKNDLDIAYGNTFSVGRNAVMTTGRLFTGVNASIVCHHKMTFGNNVMVGSDVRIFDSDFHAIYNETGDVINSDREVIIEDNVWLGARSMILKGAFIHQGAIISASSLVLGEVEKGRVYINRREGKSIGGHVIWEP